MIELLEDCTRCDGDGYKRSGDKFSLCAYCYQGKRLSNEGQILAELISRELNLESRLREIEDDIRYLES